MTTKKPQFAFISPYYIDLTNQTNAISVSVSLKEKKDRILAANKQRVDGIKTCCYEYWDGESTNYDFFLLFSSQALAQQRMEEITAIEISLKEN